MADRRHRQRLEGYLRRRKREEPLLPEHDQKPDQAAEEKAERWMVNMTVAAVMARLGEKCRETLRRYYLPERVWSSPHSTARPWFQEGGPRRAPLLRLRLRSYAYKDDSE
jgi:hypothetical protein